MSNILSRIIIIIIIIDFYYGSGPDIEIFIRSTPF